MKKAKFGLRLQYNSPVVLTFFLLSLWVLVLDELTGGWTTAHLFCVYRSSLADPLFYIRLVGHVLGHSGWDHFLGNMLLFLVVGPPMEEKYGSIPLLKAIVFTALVSGVLQCVLFPGTALLGASGIVFMLIMLASLAGAKNGSIPLTLILVAALYLGEQVYDILFVTDNIANFMHIVGGVCGTGFGLYSASHKGRRRAGRRGQT
jgi:membrane associated rhomboid family serine protease